MYCRTPSSRCGVSNTSHSRGTPSDCYEVSSSVKLIRKVEHLEEPEKQQTEVLFFHVHCIKSFVFYMYQIY